jgi:hypothetical protein
VAALATDKHERSLVPNVVPPADIGVRGRRHTSGHAKGSLPHARRRKVAHHVCDMCCETPCSLV